LPRYIATWWMVPIRVQRQKIRSPGRSPRRCAGPARTAPRCSAATDTGPLHASSLEQSQRDGPVPPPDTCRRAGRREVVPRAPGALWLLLLLRCGGRSACAASAVACCGCFACSRASFSPEPARPSPAPARPSPGPARRSPGGDPPLQLGGLLRSGAAARCRASSSSPAAAGGHPDDVFCSTASCAIDCVRCTPIACAAAWAASASSAACFALAASSAACLDHGLVGLHLEQVRDHLGRRVPQVGPASAARARRAGRAAVADCRR
jgi:hypothetical protein